ncbi:MAG: hypothetical protein ACJA0H_001211 [Francisellaceae bacterium]|jgi:uncharacterized protein (TIRG00374 family)
MKNIKKILLTILILSVFTIYFIINYDDFLNLLSFNPLLIFATSLVYSMTIIINGYALKLLILPFNIKINLVESIKVSVISTAGNFFTSSGGGMGLRAVYLKKKFSLAYTDYLSVLAGNYVLVFIVSSLIGILSLLWLDVEKGTYFYIILIFFLALLLVGFIVIFLAMAELANGFIGYCKIKKLSAKFKIVKAGLRSIFKEPILVVRLIAVTLLNFLMSFLVTYLIIKMLDINLSLPSISLLTVLASLSLFINITPANLGVKEGVYIFTSTVIGLDINKALAIALVDRAILFVVIGFLWLLVYKIFSRKTKNTLQI